MKIHKYVNMTGYKIMGTGAYAVCSLRQVKKTSKEWLKVTCKNCLRMKKQ